MIRRYKLHIFGPALCMLGVIGIATRIGVHPKPVIKPTYTIKLSSSATQQPASTPAAPQPSNTPVPAVKPSPQPVLHTKVMQTSQPALPTPVSVSPSIAPSPSLTAAGCPAGQVALDQSGTICTSFCHYVQLQGIQAEKDYYANRPDTTLYATEAADYNQLAAQANSGGDCSDQLLPIPPFTTTYPPVPPPGS